MLSAGLLNLRGSTNADKTVVRLELLQSLVRVVDEGKAGALAATILGTETEDGNLVLVGLVEIGQLVAKLVLRDVGTVRVEDVPIDVKSNLSETILLKVFPQNHIYPFDLGQIAPIQPSSTVSVDSFPRHVPSL